MKNKLPFLVLVCCMLFCIPCYADDVEVESDISLNDVFIESDIFFNENIADDNEVDLFSTSLMAIEDNSETIDYSEQLNNISHYYDYTYENYPVFDFEYDVDDFALLLKYDGFEFVRFYSPDEFYSFDYNYFGDNETLQNITLDSFRIYYSINDTSYYSLCHYSDVIETDEYTFIIVDNIETYYFDEVLSFDYAVTRRDLDDFIYDFNENISDFVDESTNIRYLLLFLVLERVMYIGWDLFSKIGGSRNE